VTDNSNNHVAANLLQHDAAFIPNESPDFCSTFVVSTASKTWFASLTGGIKSLFVVKSAFADDLSEDLGRFIGGGPSGWSPMKFSTLTSSTAKTSFPSPIKNGGISAPLPPFVVHAASAAGHALPNVGVTVSLTNNQGVPAGAEIVAGSVVHKVTDADGNVTFDNITVGKAGGYVFTATATIGGVGLQGAVSNVFNVKNK
jgi:hypothetical protein